MFYARLSENFPFIFYLFENAWNSKNEKFLTEKSTTFS